MSKGMKDKFDKGEGISASAEDTAPMGEGKKRGMGHKRKGKKRKHKGRG